eukprot:PhF_6_TR1473/c0_g1_i1/m.2652
MFQNFRPDTIDFGTTEERKKHLRAIQRMERAELGLRPPTREHMEHVRDIQHQRMNALSIPRAISTDVNGNPIVHRNVKKAKKGHMVAIMDKLLMPPQGQSRFWISRWAHITKQMINPVGSDQRTSQAWHHIMKVISSMMVIAEKMDKCGILFDIVSTSSVIDTGIPHTLGNMMYKYIEDQYYYLEEKIKFVFVGITDNVNCKAARDVFCKDPKMCKEPKAFETLDNSHTYIVFPGSGGERNPLNILGDMNGEEGLWGIGGPPGAAALMNQMGANTMLVSSGTSNSNANTNNANNGSSAGGQLSSRRARSSQGSRSNTFLTQTM